MLRAPRSLTGLPRETWVLSVVAFCVALGFGIVAPAIPLFARQFGVGTAAAGAVVSAFALMRFVSGLASGRVVDRVGERRALVGGIALVAVSSLLAGLAGSYGQLLVLRGIGGVGSAVFTIASMSLLLRVAAPGQRGQTQSVYRGGFLVGGIAGPALGGAVVGVSLRAPFFLYAGTLALACLAGAVLLPRAVQRAAVPAAAAPGQEAGSAPPVLVPDVPRPLREALERPAYRAALLSNFAVGFAVFGARVTLVPLLVVEGLHLPAGWTGTAFLVQALVDASLLLPAGRAIDARGRRVMLLTGSAVVTAGFLGLALASGPASLLVASGVLGAGTAVYGVTPSALVGDVVEGRSGTAVAVFQMASDLGAIVGPLLVGTLVDAVSFSVALVVTAAVVALSGLLGLTLPRGT